MQKSLVAFDTSHIKEYVFGTDRLKEIRGASSLLDRLNRREMTRVAEENHINAIRIYAHGGAGLFVVDSDKAETFGHFVQQTYREKSGGRASITYAVEDIPSSVPDSGEVFKQYDLRPTLEMLHYRLQEKKGNLPYVTVLPSHPFMRLCNSCGVQYAEEERHDPGESDSFYCSSCLEKQNEDVRVKYRIPETIYRILNGEWVSKAYLWDRILTYLHDIDYDLPTHPGLDRPDNFNEFRQFAGAKEHIGLIYADANDMGTIIAQQPTLDDIEIFADGVDQAIHRAMCQAIKRYLPVTDIVRDGKTVPVFPFDILLLGGDDIVMVTDAAKAMDVALTIAKEFRALTNNQYSLSVGVVLAPVKYPFGLLQEMAESVLKFAKKSAHDDRAKLKEEDRKQFDGSRINFFVVTGGSKPDFKEIYNDLYTRKDDEGSLEFHATLRPYTPEELQTLLKAIREGKNLGRTKLHQLREAVYDKNLSKSVMKALAALRSWNDYQRDYIVRRVVYGQSYEFRKRYKTPTGDPQNLLADFPRVTFPWFADGENKEYDVYRTPLLDFIELYDFVAREGGNNGNKV